jgi:hypothetical protein
MTKLSLPRDFLLYPLKTQKDQSQSNFINKKTVKFLKRRRLYFEQSCQLRKN